MLTYQNFTTFATPHLGVRAPLRGWHNDMWNVIGARTLLTSGQQLFMIDNFRKTGRPLLEILADPNSIFMQGLAKFKRRTLYANIVNDRSAVYYTTSISKIDPFTKLDKIQVNYLEGYEDIIVDPNAPIDIPEKSNATFSSRLLKGTRKTIRRIPFFIALVAYVPLGIITVLVNSGMEALRSNHRIRLYEQGLSSVQPDTYRVPLLITGIQGAVEDVYKNVNSAQTHEYLPFNVDEEAALEGMAPPQVVREDSKSSILFSNHPGGPILALTPAQFRMIQALDNVGWRKFPVHIHKHRHSHAAIIVRGDKRHSPNFGEGRVVFRHWLDEEFVM